jgi:DnaJ like chaperone protein
MNKYIWRIVCSILAFLLTHNFIVLVVGFLIGALLDNHHILGTARRNFPNRVQQIFFNTSFQILGYLAKSDGRVSASEIRTAENIMQQMQLSSELRKAAIKLFNQGKQTNFRPKICLTKLRFACAGHPHLLQTFIEIQLQMAYADSHVMSVNKENIFAHMCDTLGVSHSAFKDFRYRQQYNSHVKPDTKHSLADDYYLLGVDTTANDDELKKAYRKAMSKNHPDRMIAEGVPAEMVRIATQKTQAIKAAYERIKASR